MPSGGFFSAEKASKNKIMCIYYKIDVFACFSKKNFVVYHDRGHDQGHDKQHLLDWHLRGKTFFGESIFWMTKHRR